MISYHRAFLFFSFSFLAAVFTCNILRDIYLSFFVVILLAIVFVNFYIYSRKYIYILISIIIGLLAGIIISTSHLASISKIEKIIKNFDDTLKYELTLEIEKVYKKGDFDIDYKSKIIKIGDLIIEDKMYAIFKTKKNFTLKPGQIIKFESRIEPIKNFNETFDYTSYMQSKSIFLLSNSYSFENIGSVKQSYVTEKMYTLRGDILTTIHELYPKNEAIFLGGILIGARENIPKDLSTSFNNSGLTHLIAVSGYNITIIIVFLSYILLYFPKFLKIPLITISVIGYVMIVGDSAAVIRAGLMGLVGYYVLMSGRKGDSLAIILFTALSMLLLNPFLINYDISFQLSFLAVFGLLYTQGFFEKIFFFLPKKFAIQESFVLTLSAFVFTVPIMLFNFGQISILAPIANMLVAWTIPFAMLLGTLSIIFYSLSSSISYFIGYGEYFLLKWTTEVATVFGSLDASILKIELGSNGVYFQALYFMLVIFCIFYFQKPRED